MLGCELFATRINSEEKIQGLNSWFLSVRRAAPEKVFLRRVLKSNAYIVISTGYQISTSHWNDLRTAAWYEH